MYVGNERLDLEYSGSYDWGEIVINLGCLNETRIFVSWFIQYEGRGLFWRAVCFTYYRT